MRGCLPLFESCVNNKGCLKRTTVAMFIFGDHNINTAYQAFLKKMRTLAAMFA